MKTEKAEQMRIKYKYRMMIMKGKVWINYKGAAQLIGPDCAFHLYSSIKTDGDLAANQKKSGECGKCDD